MVIKLIKKLTVKCVETWCRNCRSAVFALESEHFLDPPRKYPLSLTYHKTYCKRGYTYSEDKPKQCKCFRPTANFENFLKKIKAGDLQLPPSIFIKAIETEGLSPNHIFHLKLQL
jgi:hypothetical protein